MFGTEVPSYFVRLEGVNHCAASRAWANKHAFSEILPTTLTSCNHSRTPRHLDFAPSCSKLLHTSGTGSPILGIQ
jgi:hypothetical protein